MVHVGQRTEHGWHTEQPNWPVECIGDGMTEPSSRTIDEL